MVTTIALLHPGEMGAAVGRCLVDNGHRVLWASTERSAATLERANASGLVDAGDLRNAVAQADVVLSVCPPHGAVQMAQDVASLGFEGIYVDANAISPTTVRQIEAIATAGKTRFVDGGIIGPPPVAANSTRMYLAGPAAQEVSALFSGGFLGAPVLDGGVGAASALKICYGAWTKGVSALLTNIRALARSEAVEDALIEEWELSQAGVVERSELVSGQARKAWRWVGEMEEIAGSFEAAGLPGGFHHGAADIYRRLTPFKDAASPVAMQEIIETVLGAAPPTRTSGSRQ